MPSPRCHYHPPELVRAVKHASSERLLRDMARAARLVASVYLPGDESLPRHLSWCRGYVLGATQCSSLTMRACLLTAFGG